MLEMSKAIPVLIHAPVSDHAHLVLLDWWCCRQATVTCEEAMFCPRSGGIWQ